MKEIYPQSKTCGSYHQFGINPLDTSQFVTVFLSISFPFSLFLFSHFTPFHALSPFFFSFSFFLISLSSSIPAFSFSHFLLFSLSVVFSFSFPILSSSVSLVLFLSSSLTLFLLLSLFFSFFHSSSLSFFLSLSLFLNLIEDSLSVTQNTPLNWFMIKSIDFLYIFSRFQTNEFRLRIVLKILSLSTIIKIFLTISC